MMSEKWWAEELFSLDDQKVLSEKVFTVLSPDDTEKTTSSLMFYKYICPRELKTDVQTKTCM